MWIIIIVLCLTHPELSELPFCTLQSQKNEAYHYITQKGNFSFNLHVFTKPIRAL